DGVVETTAFVAIAVHRHHVAEAIEGHDHVTGRLVDARVDETARIAYAAVHAKRRALAHGEELLRSAGVARRRNLCAIEDTVGREPPAEPRQRSVRFGLTRASNLVVGGRCRT